LAFFKLARENINLINIPYKWFFDISYKQGVGEIIGFYKLGQFKEDLFRSLEKQLVLTESKFINLKFFK